MLVIDEAKFPPPRPAIPPTTSSVFRDTPGLRKIPTRIHGTISAAALKIVQLRPPNFATAKVYGTRRTDPTRAGVDVSRNLSAALNPSLFPKNNTRTDHIVQMENPMCSAKIENHRFFVAMRRPLF